MCAGWIECRGVPKFRTMECVVLFGESALKIDTIFL